MHLHRTAVSVGLTLLATACSPDDDTLSPLAPVDEPVAEDRFGLLMLTHDRGEPGVTVSGQLMATRGPSRSAALHALTQPEQAWLVTETVEAGECRAMHTEHGALNPGSTIDLLSVGDVSVSAPDRRDAPLDLPPRDFPPVSFALSGVVYDGDAPEAVPYRSGGLYRVSAPGDQLGPLGGAIVAPRPVTIEPSPIDDSGLLVRIGDAEDALIVVSRDEGRATTGVLCRTRRGEVLVPREALERLGPGDTQIAAARVRRSPLLVDGLADAELVFMTRDTIDLQLPDLRSTGEGP